MPEAYDRRLQVPELFRRGYALRTLLLWSCFFISLITLFGISNWLPLLLDQVGLSAGQIAAINAAGQTGGLVGSIAGARILMRQPPMRTAAFFYVPAACWWPVTRLQARTSRPWRPWASSAVSS